MSIILGEVVPRAGGVSRSGRDRASCACARCSPTDVGSAPCSADSFADDRLATRDLGEGDYLGGGVSRSGRDRASQPCGPCSPTLVGSAWSSVLAEALAPRSWDVSRSGRDRASQPCGPCSPTLVGSARSSGCSFADDRLATRVLGAVMEHGVLAATRSDLGHCDQQEVAG